jgi:hypothetical protein
MGEKSTERFLPTPRDDFRLLWLELVRAAFLKINVVLKGDFYLIKQLFLFLFAYNLTMFLFWTFFGAVIF